MADERSNDRGRAARGLSFKEWLQLIGLAVVLASIFWRGGQMTEKLDTMAGTVEKISADVAVVKTELPVLKAKVEMHEKELGQQNSRLIRVESVPTRGIPRE